MSIETMNMSTAHIWVQHKFWARETDDPTNMSTTHVFEYNTYSETETDDAPNVSVDIKFYIHTPMP